MKKITSLKPPCPSGTPPLKRRGIYPALMVFLLSAFCLLPSALNAQAKVNKIFAPDSLQKIELEVTPEIEKMVVKKINDTPEEFLSSIYGIKNKAQIEHLHLGKPFPHYYIVNERLRGTSGEPVHVSTTNVFRTADGKPLSLRFANYWNVPVMSSDEPLAFGEIRPHFGDDGYLYFNEYSYIGRSKTENIAKHFQNYEYKDSVIGSVIMDMYYFIIRKENKPLFVEVYNEITGEYFKNEYSFNELINHIKELNLREKEAQRRYFAQIADKTELIITPEITEMLVREALSFRGRSDEELSDWGIKNRALLVKEKIHAGKPIPLYTLFDENVTFRGYWMIPVMSEGVPILMVDVKLEDDGQYSWAGTGGGEGASVIHNYEYNDLVVGFLKIGGSTSYLIIRKDNKDIYVEGYDYKTGEYFKNEYTLNEIMDKLKKRYGHE